MQMITPTLCVILLILPLHANALCEADNIFGNPIAEDLPTGAKVVLRTNNGRYSGKITYPIK